VWHCQSSSSAVLVTQLTLVQSGGIVYIIIVTALVANYGYADNTNKAGAAAAIVFMYLVVTCYGFGVDASSYIYYAEIFPTNIRAQGVGFSISGLFLMNTSEYFLKARELLSKIRRLILVY
jgi:hypothetical protein